MFTNTTKALFIAFFLFLSFVLWSLSGINVRFVDGVQRSCIGDVTEADCQKLVSRAVDLRASFLDEAQKRLGIYIKHPERVVVRFSNPKGILKISALTRTRFFAGGRYQLITVFAGPILLGVADLDKTLLHESAHALMRSKMPLSYWRLPDWLRESIALWTTGQLEEKAVALILSKLSNGEDPFLLLNGLESKSHGLEDYFEDALFFEYINLAYGKEKLQSIIKSITEGVRYKQAFEQALNIEWRVLLDRFESFALADLSRRIKEADLSRLNLSK
jgi:hypothetical protein